ncbi:MAG: efflux transporter outer membrane subunit [Methylovirgula sp.]|uniref:efflux transporter outer membrane subunit n=1 Tax=Methylovirgula sp. TaxID=1978224 RepID=UPI003075FB75
MPRIGSRLPFLACLGASLAGCMMGPDYVRPAAPIAPHFKEAKKGWKLADPADALDRGEWWAVYHDAKLASLLSQVEVSNQTVKQALEAYHNSVALIREAQANYFPTVTNSYSATYQHQGSGTFTSGAVAARSSTFTTFNPVANATWDLDVWGRIGRQVESQAAAAQVSAADLQNAKLSEQAALATAYFDMREEDSLKALLDRTIVAFKKTLTITQNQFKAGTVSQGDVITAQTQLLQTEAQAIDTGVARAQFEHSIAILIGRPPSDLSLTPAELPPYPPRVPATVPSLLLERRPDIAAAERQMQEENALIGVAVANFYPDINLSGAFGFAGATPLPISAAAEAWSIAGTATQTIFDGGLLAADLAAARATYAQNIASYRQTVLTAFDQVEDELAALRILAKEAAKQVETVKAARQAVQIDLNQYQAGTVPFTTVVTGEATQLQDEENLLTTRQNLFIASVALIEALGGGWDASELPSLARLSKVPTFTPPL